MQRKLLVIVGILGALTIAIGAFGAHSLKSQLSAVQIQTFQTGVSYQMMHVLALLALACLASFTKSTWIKITTYLFVAGILLFSGSLYLLACQDIITVIPLRILGPLTPIGGLCFILGWISVVVLGLKLRT